MAMLSIKFRQGADEFVVQDLSQVLGLEEHGITFTETNMRLQFQAIKCGLHQSPDEAVVLLTRAIEPWLERARIAAAVRQGPPVELLVKHGAIHYSTTYGRDYIAWQVMDGRIEQRRYPATIGGERALTLTLDLETREGRGRDVMAINAQGSASRPAGNGGEYGHIKGIDDGGLRLTGGVRAEMFRSPWNSVASTTAFYWQPMCPYYAADTSADPAASHQVIYDIRQDVDGGAWWASEAAMQTSWYSAWGPFPTLTVWEFTDTVLTVRDGNDQSVYTTFTMSDDGNLLDVADLTDMRIASVAVMNRHAWVGLTSDGNTANGGLYEIDFEADRGYKMTASSLLQYNGPVATADDGLSYSSTAITSQGLPHADVYDVHAAFVDGVGQMVAIATGTAASVWKRGYLGRNLGSSILDFTTTSRTVVKHVWLTSKGRLYWNATDPGVVENSIYVVSEVQRYTADQADAHQKVYTAGTDPALLGGTTTLIHDIWVTARLGFYGDGDGTIFSENNYEPGDVLYVGSTSGLTIVEQKFGDESNGAVRYVTRSYSTGPMIGNTRGWWIGGEENAASLNDRTRNNNDLTVVGFTGGGATTAADWSSSPVIRGKSLIFDGTNDYLTSADADFNVNNQALTVGAFVRVQAVAVGDKFIMSKGQTTQAAYLLKLEDNGAGGSRFEFSVTTGAGTYVANTGSVTVSDDLLFVYGRYGGTGLLECGYYTVAGGVSTGTDITANGTIASTADQLAVGARSDGAAGTRWNNLMTNVFIAAEYFTTKELNYIARCGFTAGLQAYTTHELGGNSNRVNSVCATEDGGLVLVATGDAANTGAITFWRHWYDHQDRTPVVIDAGVHTSVATLSGLGVASTETNRWAEAPVQDIYFWHEGGVPLDGAFWAAEAALSYAYWRHSDGKVVFVQGQTTALASTAALPAWEIGDVIGLCMRHSYDHGVSIWSQRGVSTWASIGASATYSGEVVIATQIYKNKVFFGCDFLGRHPVGQMYDMRVWPIVLSNAMVQLIERGRGEMPYIWSGLYWQPFVNYSTGDDRYDNRAIVGNVPGDKAAGLWAIIEAAANEQIIGMRAYHGAYTRYTYEAEHYQGSLDGDTSVVVDSSASHGEYLSTSPSSTINTKRASIKTGLSGSDMMRLYGSYRLVAVLHETGVTAAAKISFGIGGSGTFHDFTTEQKVLPCTGAWVMQDFGEITLPPASMSLLQRGGDLEMIDNVYISDGSVLNGLINYYVEQPLGAANDIYLDCVILVPYDWAIGSIVRDISSGGVASMLACTSPLDFGASVLNQLNDSYEGYRVVTQEQGAEWTGGRVWVPVGIDTGICFLGRNTSQAACPNTYARANLSIAFCTPKLVLRPFFMWVR